MALKATIYKADLQVADLDRHYYADHSLTLARHPSETDERLMTRLLMYALYAQEGIAFTRGLSETDEPEIWVRDLTGAITLWVDIGQPDEVRLKKACARARQVIVLTHSGGWEIWWKQTEPKVARLGNLAVAQLPVATCQALAGLARRSMRLQCLVQDGEIWLSNDDTRVAAALRWLKATA